MKNKKQIEEERALQDIISDWIENSEKIDLVKVIWYDANTMSGTSGFQEIVNRGLLRAETIGYLIHEDKESIAICGFLFPDREKSIIDPSSFTAFRDTHIIPKNWIKAIISLKPDYERSKELLHNLKDGEKVK